MFWDDVPALDVKEHAENSATVKWHVGVEGRILFVVRDPEKAIQVMHAIPGVHAVGVGGSLMGRGPWDVILVSWHEAYAATQGAQYIEEVVKLKLAPGGKLIYV